jgi:large subunit ribosomal protein L25
MSAHFELTAVSRGDAGKGASRRLRHQGLVPAILYGGDAAPQTVSLSHRELAKALENEAFFSSIVTIKLEGTDLQAIIKDLQRHPAKPLLMHADFQRVSKDRKINVHIPLHFINQDKCNGVKLQGGLIQHNANEIYITCFPQDLPGYIEVDMTPFNLGDSVHISDLKLPPGVESVALLQGPEHDLPVATVLATKGGPVEENPAAAAAAAAKAAPAKGAPAKAGAAAKPAAAAAPAAKPAAKKK